MRRFRLLLFLLLAMNIYAQENTNGETAEIRNANASPAAVDSGERFLSFAGCSDERFLSFAGCSDERFLSFEGCSGERFLSFEDSSDAPLATNSINFSSPEIHADRSVTFRLYAPNAKRVALESDCLYPKPDLSAFGEKTRKQRMKRNSAGVWSFTTQPLQPELYFYNFIVDGKRVHDPANPDSTFVLLHQVSLFAVGGSAYSDLYQHAPVEQRGRIDSISYYSEKQGITRRLLVYIPKGYDNTCDSDAGIPPAQNSGERFLSFAECSDERFLSFEGCSGERFLSFAANTCISPAENVNKANHQSPLPILYLLHGISGDERGWIEHGRAADILDNLIAQKRIPPMLVVMPDCNVVRRIRKGKRTNLLRNMLNYPILCAGGFEKAFSELEEFIASRYPISLDPMQHAIAGLSSGARQAANIVNLQPDTFGTVGIFSPVVHRRQLPNQKNPLSSPSIAPTSSSPSVALTSSSPSIALTSSSPSIAPTSSSPSVAPEFNSGNSRYLLYLGTNDLFYKNGKRYYHRLQKCGINCQVFEYDGGHTWRNWRHFLVDFLPQLFQVRKDEMLIKNDKL